MRESLFRGKTAQKEWVYGFYVKHGECDWIYTGEVDKLNVYSNHHGTKISPSVKHLLVPETVCQYTGKPDDNGNKIWEEDFVKINDEWIGRVVWRDDVTAFCVFPNDDIEHETYCLGFYIEEGYKVEVIGNIFDNPGLLREEH